MLNNVIDNLQEFNGKVLQEPLYSMMETIVSGTFSLQSTRRATLCPNCQSEQAISIHFSEAHASPETR
jgi:hypothetical protein